MDSFETFDKKLNISEDVLKSLQFVCFTQEQKILKKINKNK